MKEIGTNLYSSTLLVPMNHMVSPYSNPLSSFPWHNQFRNSSSQVEILFGGNNSGHTSIFPNSSQRGCSPVLLVVWSMVTHLGTRGFILVGFIVEDMSGTHKGSLMRYLELCGK